MPEPDHPSTMRSHGLTLRTSHARQTIRPTARLPVSISPTRRSWTAAPSSSGAASTATRSFHFPAGVLAEAIDIDLVYDFPSRWWGGRVAGPTHKPGASIWGVQFEIAGVDWPIIQHKEGAVTGMCVEREVRIRAGGVERGRHCVHDESAARPERWPRE